MITNASNKMMSARDAFIIQKGKTFKPEEIRILLEREGFRPLTRQRIQQIIGSKQRTK